LIYVPLIDAIVTMIFWVAEDPKQLIEVILPEIIEQERLPLIGITWLDERSWDQARLEGNYILIVPFIFILFVGVSETIMAPVVLTYFGLNVIEEAANLSGVNVTDELEEEAEISTPICTRKGWVVKAG